MIDKEGEFSNQEREDVMLQQIDTVFAESQAGQVPPNIALKKIMFLFAKIERNAKIQERAKLERLRSTLGFESLGTDQEGRCSSEQLAMGGVAFATGEAVVCLAVAITHPEWGIGAAHYNPLTSQRVEEGIAKKLYGDLEDERTTHGIRPHPMITDGDLASHVALTINRALGQFSQLHPDEHVLPDGTTFHMIGLNFLSPDYADATLEFARGEIGKAVHAKLVGTGSMTNVHISPHLGESGGIIYGGTNHSEYSEPRTYILS